jgi:small subunit ribosomal protein S17
MEETEKKVKREKEDVRASPETSFKVVSPEQKLVSTACEDPRCPVHGGLRARGRVFVGKVISDKMMKTVNVEWSRQHFLQKFERFEKRRSRVKAHNPMCINAREGDMVKIAECRSLSKTKKFVVIEKLKGEKKC